MSLGNKKISKNGKARIPVLLFFVSVLAGSQAASAQPQAFKLTAERSSVHFDAKSTLHPFSGDTRTLSGEMVWDDEAGRLADGAVVRVPVRPILTGEPKRDGEMRKMFAAAEFPDIEFRASKVTPIPPPSGAPVSASSSSGRYRLEGTLKIRRVERTVGFDVTVTPTPSGALEISGEALVRTDWFELKPPSVLGLVRVLPEVKVRFQSVWEKV
jgi:polyisoprenoid-binding protein YceI